MFGESVSALEIRDQYSERGGEVNESIPTQKDNDSVLSFPSVFDFNPSITESDWLLTQVAYDSAMSDSNSRLQRFDPKHSRLVLEGVENKETIRLEFDYRIYPPFQCHILRAENPEHYTQDRIVSEFFNDEKINELYISCKLPKNLADSSVLDDALIYFNRFPLNAPVTSRTIFLSQEQADAFDKEVNKLDNNKIHSLNNSALKYLSNQKLHDRGEGKAWLHQEKYKNHAEWKSVSPQNRLSWSIKSGAGKSLIERFDKAYEEQENKHDSPHIYSQFFKNCHFLIMDQIKNVVGVNVTTNEYREKFHIGIPKYWLFLNLHPTITLATCFPSIYAVLEEYAFRRASLTRDDHPYGITPSSIKNVAPLVIPTVGIFTITSMLALLVPFIWDYCCHRKDPLNRTLSCTDMALGVWPILVFASAGICAYAFHSPYAFFSPVIGSCYITWRDKSLISSYGCFFDPLDHGELTPFTWLRTELFGPVIGIITVIVLSVCLSYFRWNRSSRAMHAWIQKNQPERDEEMGYALLSIVSASGGLVAGAIGRAWISLPIPGLIYLLGCLLFTSLYEIIDYKKNRNTAIYEVITHTVSTSLVYMSILLPLFFYVVDKLWIIAQAITEIAFYEWQHNGPVDFALLSSIPYCDFFNKNEQIKNSISGDGHKSLHELCDNPHIFLNNEDIANLLMRSVKGYILSQLILRISKVPTILSACYKIAKTFVENKEEKKTCRTAAAQCVTSVAASLRHTLFGRSPTNSEAHLLSVSQATKSTYGALDNNQKLNNDLLVELSQHTRVSP